MIDFIGDIHGHADKLEELLKKLGYNKKNGVYAHPESTVFFVGDYIDRGPKIRETLELVKNMVDNGSAIALMGNHEYNALCFHYPETEGGHLRKHLIKNIMQHYETLRQFQNFQEEYESYLDWFKTLPLFYETENFRVVHACWNDNHINFLKKHLINNRLTDELIYEAAKVDSPLHNAIEETLKGKEIPLPPNYTFPDKDGNLRQEIRVKWWENPEAITYKNYSVEAIGNLPESFVDTNSLKNNSFYSPQEKPVFFGHYWLKGKPALYKNNICCLDYSVAKKGSLAAYRFKGEEKLDDENFVYVKEKN